MKGFTFNEMLEMTDREREWFYKRAVDHFEAIAKEQRKAKQQTESARRRR